MASFTDNPSLTPFTPYTQQLPLEAMYTVGLQKQQQYNQGIEKIQSHIDNVAGMDIMKPEHREYLQSKLNQLGGDLKKVAAGDFSNYQLTNSVGGMIGQIGKDPLIQNAVKSTQFVRKGQQDLEAAKKAGKSSPENEAWWNDQVNSWMNNPDVKASFSGGYIPYKDVDAKLRAIAEKIHEVDNSIDVPYQRNGDGSFRRGPDGNPLVDDAMLRIKTKGKPAEKILSNFYTSLDETDKQQLMITANYHYKGATKDTFRAEVASNYSSNKKRMNDSLVTLNLDLQTNPKLTSTQKGEIQAKINDINTRLASGTLEAELQQALSNIDNITNLGDFKYRLYTQKYLGNLADDLSYQSYIQELHNNPYAQMGLEKDKLNLQYAKNRQDQDNWERRFAFDKDKFLAEQAKKTGATKPATPDGVPTDLPAPKLLDVEARITNILGDEKTKKLGQIDVLNSEYAPLLTDSSLSTVNQKKAFLDGLYKQYSEDPSGMTELKNPIVREYLEIRRGLQTEASIDQRLYNETIEASKHFDEKISNVYKDEKGFVVGGREIYKAEELNNVLITLNNKFTADLSNSNVPVMEGDAPPVDTEGFLREYRGTRMEPLANALIKQKRFQPLSPDERRLVDRATEIGKKYTRKGVDVTKDKLKFQSEYLEKLMPERQTMKFTLDVNNSKIDDRIDERAVEALLGSKFAEFEDLGNVDNEKSTSFDPATISKFKADKEATYVIRKAFDGSANLLITSKGEQQIVPMTASEFSTFFPDYSRTNSIDNIKNVILKSKNKTTNISGKKDAVNAYITGYQLPRLVNTKVAHLVRVDVEGSPSNRGSDKDRYVIRMYVNDNGVWKDDIITQQGCVNEATLHTDLEEIGTKTVQDLLKKNSR